jgi:hypothetical protein
VPHITKRKISVTIQDFCNLLGGGLVSFSTLSASTLASMNSMGVGAFIAVYQYKPEDVLPGKVQSLDSAASSTAEGASSSAMAVAPAPAPAPGAVASHAHNYYAICWRGNSRTVNVMCGRREVDAMKHSLDALGVLRDKVSAPKRIPPPGEASQAKPTDSGEAESKEDAEAKVEASAGNDSGAGTEGN